VRVVPVLRRSIERSLEATADVVSLDVVDLFPERSEPVVKILVEEGDPVQPGQLLAQLRDEVEELAVSDAEVKLSEAKNALEQARTDHQRDLSLMDRAQDSPTALISERELETSRMTLVTAQTNYEAAKVSLERARIELRQTELRSPIAGTVALRDISLGDMANPSSRAFQIVDASHPKAVFFRPQRELALLRVGQELEARSEALPGVVLRGRIERIAPTVDQTSGTVKITAALDPGSVPIPIGILVTLRLVLDRHPDALLVPKKAVIRESDGTHVFVVRDGRAHRADFQPGFEEAEDLEVLPCDLRADDRVVVVGGDRLSDGDPVELADTE